MYASVHVYRIANKKISSSNNILKAPILLA
jgi:hypothetical protein